MEGGSKEKLKEGGFVVKFETVVTLHQCALFEGDEEEQTDSGAGDGGGDQPSASFHWEVLEYGVPVVVANSNGVVLCLADVESGDKICEFTLSSSSQYVTVDDHFHILADPSGCYGISYDDGGIGEKVLALLKRAVLCSSIAEEEEGLEPTPKQQRIEDDSTDGDEDVVDGPFGRRKLRQTRSLEISKPQDFVHVSHVGTDTPISELTQAMSWTDTLKQRRRKRGSGERPIDIPIYNCKEVDTVSTSSFVEVFSSPPGPPAPPPGPPPPPAPPPPTVSAPPAKVVLKKKHSATSSVSVNKDVLSSLANEIKKGVVLKPVGSDRSSSGSRRSSDKSYDSLQDELKGGVILKSVSSSRVMTLPPPPRRTESEKLLFEITTFRRTKLRSVTTTSTNMTDFPSSTKDDKSLESVMKKGLDTMMKKISGLGISNVVTVGSDTSEGFDGLFEANE